MNQLTNILLIALAVIVALVLIGMLSMWLMHGMMMGPGMMGWRLGNCDCPGNSQRSYRSAAVSDKAKHLVCWHPRGSAQITRDCIVARMMSLLLSL
jgi:hypothetical protein